MFPSIRELSDDEPECKIVPIPFSASAHLLCFSPLCEVVERVEGGRFRALVERLPRRAPTGEAALAEVIRLVQEQTTSMPIA